jgi:hypothetical protein
MHGKLTKFDFPLRKETGSAGMQPDSAKKGGSTNAARQKKRPQKAASFIIPNVNLNKKLNLKPHTERLYQTNPHYYP